MSKNKKLHRIKKDSIFAGVSTGLAEYFGIDPVIFRAIFIILTLANGIGILIYLALVVIIPQNPREEKIEFIDENKVQEIAKEIKEKSEDIARKIKEESEEIKEKKWWEEKRNLFGIFLIILGVIIILEIIFPIDVLNFKLIWGVALALIGLYFIFKK